MSKFKFINLVDYVFLLFTIFLIVFAWVQYFVRNILFSFLISAFITLAIMWIIGWFKCKKRTLSQNQIEENKSLSLFKLAIQTLPNSKLTSLIKLLLPIDIQIKTSKGDILFEKENISHLITFQFAEDLTESKLLEIIKQKSATHLTIIGTNFNPEVQTLSKAFTNKTIELISLEQLFKICNNKNIKLDTSNIDINNPKTSIKELFKNSLSRNKSKGYFISGLVLLFTSLIIPYKVYYVMFSSILFVLSILCRFKPKSKASSTIFN